MRLIPGGPPPGIFLMSVHALTGARRGNGPCRSELGATMLHKWKKMMVRFAH